MNLHVAVFSLSASVLFAVWINAVAVATPVLAGTADPGEAVPSRAAQYDGRRAVRLSAALQAQGGVELFTPQATEMRPEILAYGKVLDLQPLLQLRALYNQSKGEHEVAQATLKSSDAALQRLVALQDSGAGVSARQFQEVRSQRQGDFARVTAAELRLRDVHDQVLQDWGSVLTGWALDAEAREFSAIIRQEEVLLLITLGPDETLDGDMREILVSRSSDRLEATPASLISPAPYTLGTQGETYFFRAPAGRFRVGMRIYAWLQGDGAPSAGVLLPASAVVWYAGRPWVYLRHGGDLFVRHAIVRHTAGGEQWFVPDPSLAGLEVVRSGVQMLLSEESRGEIPDEDEEP